ncbi:hypothetical protein [Claveliimonas sp.]|uniref:hypothetical protein n=1 Tax=Claveliimonas sp. TaxID=3076672 RepID=UPI00307B6E40
MFSYTQLRKDYPEFIYHGYQIKEEKERICLEYDFEIPGLSSFHPTWEFPKKDEENRKYADDSTFRNLAFSLGMVELISYWKTACPPKVIVEAGALTAEQILWWKDLYFNGLGEFYYTNGISENQEDFMEIVSAGQEISADALSDRRLEGCLVPVGGGKDSAVTLSLLKGEKETNCCYIINPRGATLKTVERAGYGEAQMCCVKRTLDKNMLELNKQGYLNGHTPFSAIVAFSATIAAYMEGKKYIVLSNESSANESTVEGSTVNHQYSKSFRFEKAFHDYEAEYIGSGTYYFSMLRPLSEFQIAGYFAKCREFHDIFRSCNAGSKEDKWCGHCPKCLFVCLILSPFLSGEEIIRIFGRDMLNDPDMTEDFRKLTGMEREKPFECVGSRDEVNAAISLTIDRMMGQEKDLKKLPGLFRYYVLNGLYRENDPASGRFFRYFDEENLLPERYLELVRRECTKGER